MPRVCYAATVFMIAVGEERTSSGGKRNEVLPYRGRLVPWTPMISKFLLLGISPIPRDSYKSLSDPVVGPDLRLQTLFLAASRSLSLPNGL